MALLMIHTQKMDLRFFEFKVLDQIICKQFKLNRCVSSKPVHKFFCFELIHIYIAVLVEGLA